MIFALGIYFFPGPQLQLRCWWLTETAHYLGTCLPSEWVPYPPPQHTHTHTLGALKSLAWREETGVASLLVM